MWQLHRSRFLSSVIPHHHRQPFELPRNPRKRKKSGIIVARIGDASWRDVRKKREGRTGWRATGEVAVGLAEGGIYEIAGHPTVGDGESRRPVGSGLDVCACVRGWKSLESRVHRGRALARACTSRTGHAGFRGGRILEKPRPERHWPPTEPRVPLLGQSRRELITAAVLLSAFRLLKTLRFRALYQREAYVRTYVCMYVRTYISCSFRHRSPRRSTIFFFSRKFPDPACSLSMDAGDRSLVPTFAFDIGGR